MYQYFNRELEIFRLFSEFFQTIFSCRPYSAKKPQKVRFFLSKAGIDKQNRNKSWTQFSHQVVEIEAYYDKCW